MSEMKKALLQVKGTHEMLHLLRTYFDPNEAVEITAVLPAREFDYVSGSEVKFKVEFKSKAPPAEAIIYNLRDIWVQENAIQLNRDEADQVVDALYEAWWSCRELARSHGATARQYHLAGYGKSGDARDGCEKDSRKRSDDFDKLRTKILDRLGRGGAVLDSKEGSG